MARSEVRGQIAGVKTKSEVKSQIEEVKTNLTLEPLTLGLLLQSDFDF